MCFSIESGSGGALAYTGAPRPLPTPQPAHNTKVSRDLASSQVTRIAVRSAFWELIRGAGDPTEVVARPAAPTPIPHAPGARMTVVTLTPSNHEIYIAWSGKGYFGDLRPPYETSEGDLHFGGGHLA